MTKSILISTASQLFTCRWGGGDILQDREQQATAQGSLSRPGASLWGQVEDSIGLEQSGDQQLHQAANLSLDPRTWTSTHVHQRKVISALQETANISCSASQATL